MCKQTAIEGVNINLNYMKEDVDSALTYAAEIKDPELTEKLNKLKTETVGVKDYIKSKTDAKTG